VPNTTLSFAPGVTTQAVNVTVNGDTTVEPNETFNVNLSSASPGATISDNLGIGTISNDDVVPGASFSINDVTQVEGNAGTSIFAFTVTRGGDLTGTVTVVAVTSDGSATTANNDYVAVPNTTLSFAPGVTTQAVNVTVNGDTNVEPNETFNVNLSSASPGATISDNLGVGTISNDELAVAPTLMVPALSRFAQVLLALLALSTALIVLRNR
jgi:hypothetical protein